MSELEKIVRQRNARLAKQQRKPQRVSDAALIAALGPAPPELIKACETLLKLAGRNKRK